VTRTIKIESFAYSERFQAKFQKLQPDVLISAKAALELLKTNPEARTLRLHTLLACQSQQYGKLTFLRIIRGK
jgi:hypothetical protein